MWKAKASTESVEVLVQVLYLEVFITVIIKIEIFYNSKIPYPMFEDPSNHAVLIYRNWVTEKPQSNLYE